MIWPFRKKRAVLPAATHPIDHATEFVVRGLCLLSVCVRNKKFRPDERDMVRLDTFGEALNKGRLYLYRARRDLEARMNGEPEGVRTRKWPDYR